MYVVSITNENRVLDVYNTEVYLDEDVNVFPITNDDFQKAYQSGNHGDWILQGENLVYDPLPLVEMRVPDTVVRINNLPVSVL